MAGPLEYELHPDVAADEPVDPNAVDSSGEFNLMILTVKIKADVTRIDDPTAERMVKELEVDLRDVAGDIKHLLRHPKYTGLRVEFSF